MQQSIAMLELLTMNMVSDPEVVEKKKHHQYIRYGLDVAMFAYRRQQPITIKTKMTKLRNIVLACFLTIVAVVSTPAIAQRYVIADQDASGPAGSDMTSLLVLLQSPEVKLLGITVVTGDGWRDEEVAHSLRLLELIGRTDVKVYVGAEYPLVRTFEETKIASQLYGGVAWLGAWSWKEPRFHEASVIPKMQEGSPTTKPASEDAAHFMIRMVHQYPHQVTIYAAGPMTNIALAVRIDSEFASLAKELVIMGGSLSPQTADPEFVNSPRHEFNYWFDPEAARITLRAPWAKITDTTVDASLETNLNEEMLADWAKLNTPAARYLVKYTTMRKGYLWDELAAAAWLDPTIVKREREVYMDVNVMHGPTYGDTLIWDDKDKPAIPLQKVHAQVDIDFPKLEKALHTMLASPAPGAQNPIMDSVK
jgi:purine nucleosidase